MEKIYVEEYGCPANIADAEIMKGLLKKAGYEIIDSPEESDLNIICTCAVKTPTEQKMIHKIKYLCLSNKPLIVAGCMPKIEKEVIEKIAPDASMLGPNSIQKVVDVVYATLEGKRIVFLEDLRKPKVCLPKVSKNDVIYITTISTGCLSDCSYCCVKQARGRLYSFPLELIEKEIKESIRKGFKEVWITSQDNGCYGMDIGMRLPYLLEKISKIPGKFFVRVGMMNPSHIKNITEDLIEAYKSEKIFKFLHLPVQSGSDRILKLMNRRYTIKHFLEIVNNFKREFPMLTLSTDIIVGFPRETERDYMKTLQLVEKIKPDIINISKYGNRPNTPAAEMEQIPRQIINERTKKLSDLVKKIGLEKNKRWVGWKGEVLIDEYGKTGIIGRNFAYKPIVVKTDKNLMGKFVEVKIIDAKSTYLVAEFFYRGI